MAVLLSLALGVPATAQTFTPTAQTFIPIDCPGYLESEALGMNDFGTIVGTCSNDLFETYSGYLRRGGVFSILDAPGSVNTTAWDVNNLGAVVGDYIGEDGNFHGFLYRGGRFTTIDFPGASAVVG